MDSTQREKYIINSEIRILEKQKRELLNEIQRMDFSHKEQVRQMNQQIQTLASRRDSLDEQIKVRRETLASITEAYEQAKNSLQKLIDSSKKT